MLPFKYMNRIILIGNGFDLAHGLPTRYEDFINWYWEQWGKRLRSSSNKIEIDPFCSFVLKEDVGLGGWYLVWPYHYKCSLKSCTDRELIDLAINDHQVCEYSVTSVFFSKICNAIDSKGWVDIEKEYYDLLLEVVLRPESCNYTVQELNNHLNYIQELLFKYLSIVSSKDITCNAEIQKIIVGKIPKDDISISNQHVFNDYVTYLIQHDDAYEQLLYRYGIDGANRHFMAEDIKRLKKQFTESSEIEEIYLRDLIIPENILLLNFNYTELADKYGQLKSVTINHIHGDLSQSNNIIFGYGDELDEDYRNLLKQSDNECLRNIKSIKYLESNNYRNILKFIESGPYQIYIMGHSCGKSDRTMLNTLFEHKHCVSIKPYYYRKPDGSDNYIEIVQSICRNFTDMKLMRDRVVNKTFCEPLPQIFK